MSLHEYETLAQLSPESRKKRLDEQTLNVRKSKRDIRRRLSQVSKDPAKNEIIISHLIEAEAIYESQLLEIREQRAWTESGSVLLSHSK